MKLCRTASDIRTFRASLGPDVAFVPTMGYLHEGHLELVRRARELAPNVIASIFVNPLQFGPGEDFGRYPRDEERDLDLLRAEGVAAVFLPMPQDVTPDNLIVTVDPGSMATTLCGASRPGHFRGVCTIVLKLFNLVQPSVAVFGWKDAQQLLIIRKMVRDLDLAINIEGVATIREPDGLAMSSRNAYLTPEQRAVAPQLQQGLVRIRRAVDGGESNAGALMDVFKQHLAAYPEFRLDYISIVSMQTLQPLSSVVKNDTLIATAAWLGTTRIIDNTMM